MIFTRSWCQKIQGSSPYFSKASKLVYLVAPCKKLAASGGEFLTPSYSEWLFDCLRSRTNCPRFRATANEPINLSPALIDVKARSLRSRLLENPSLTVTINFWMEARQSVREPSSQLGLWAFVAGQGGTRIQLKPERAFYTEFAETRWHYLTKPRLPSSLPPSALLVQC